MGHSLRNIETYDLLLTKAEVVNTSLPVGHLAAAFVEALGEIVVLGLQGSRVAVLLFNLHSRQLTTRSKETGTAPIGNYLSLEVVESGHKLFVLSTTRENWQQLSILTIRSRLIIEWETVDARGPRIRGRNKAAIHALCGMVIVYGGRHSYTGRSNQVDKIIIHDQHLRETVEVGREGMTGFTSEGRWPSVLDCRGTVVSGDKLIVLTWKGKEDMVELEILRD